MTTFTVLLPCAGSGARFGGAIPKQYIKLGSKSVLEHTVAAFLQLDIIDKIVIVAGANDQYIDHYANISPKVVIARVGGDTRAQSVLNGLKMLALNTNDWVLVHDVARCCITPDLIKYQIEQLQGDQVGGILAIPATDTVKLGSDGVITSTLDRSSVYLAQTPQMFRYGILLDSLENVVTTVTDEASAVEEAGLKVRLVEGSANNIKLTYPADITLAKLFLGL